MMSGPFDFMFDFDEDGELDPVEEAMLIDFLDDMQKKDSSDDDEEEEDKRKLLYPDLDFDELEYMDEEERREVLEEAGYDPDDPDFDFDQRKLAFCFQTSDSFEEMYQSDYVVLRDFFIG